MHAFSRTRYLCTVCVRFQAACCGIKALRVFLVQKLRTSLIVKLALVWQEANKMAPASLTERSWGERERCLVLFPLAHAADTNVFSSNALVHPCVEADRLQLHCDGFNLCRSEMHAKGMNALSWKLHALWVINKAYIFFTAQGDCTCTIKANIILLLFIIGMIYSTLWFVLFFLCGGWYMQRINGYKVHHPALFTYAPFFCSCDAPEPQEPPVFAFQYHLLNYSWTFTSLASPLLLNQKHLAFPFIIHVYVLSILSD